MSTTPADVLDRLRGAGPARRHNARTIAALTSNPGCARRAVLDAAGVDKPRLADRVGFPGTFGQSRFALARGNSFEAMLKADGCALLRSVLAGVLGPGASAAGYDDLGEDADDTLAARHARTRGLLAAPGGPALVDHPLLTLDVAGRAVFLEPDLIAFQAAGRYHVVEIKSFAIVDGQADSAKVSAAAVQAAVYVLALRRLLAELGHDERLVSHDVVLVCPEDFSLRPTAVVIDIRKQLATLRRQLARLASVGDLAAALPDQVSFDPALPPADLIAALHTVAARYAPECLSTCELAAFCRHESAGRTAALGRPVRDALGGVETVAEVLAYAAGAPAPDPDQAEAAALLRTAARLRAEALARPADPA
ncbi:hypothetical protein EV385_4108 [Krasilnikovia cinnamomea]|uniref:Secreted protein n=1 Tax=Krasilnikovia cinnamomea TaxID=349313 RepID=A0A4Q7ZMM9_9ACTN|nr:hypothetical protein [Krasilnikovia cinnamomea]RZU52260.1 hypothetical protein EV385_4108 [Krasilnikovia cinnamomea]